MVLENSDHQYAQVSCKRSKNGKPCKDQWVYQQNKIKSLKGEKYFGRRMTNEGKTVFDVEKEERKMKEPCLCVFRETSKRFKCKELDEGSREKIFKEFWNMTWNERKIYVQQLVHYTPVKQRKSEATNSRRSGTFVYNF